MRPAANNSIENKFSSLSTEEKVSVISHGVALRLSDWNGRFAVVEDDRIRMRPLMATHSRI